MLNNNNFNNNNNLNILKHFQYHHWLAYTHTPFSIDAYRQYGCSLLLLFQFSVTCRKDIQREKEKSKGLQPKQEEEYCELISVQYSLCLGGHLIIWPTF